MEITEPINFVFSVEITALKEDDSDWSVLFEYLWIVSKLLPENSDELNYRYQLSVEIKKGNRDGRKE